VGRDMGVCWLTSSRRINTLFQEVFAAMLTRGSMARYSWFRFNTANILRNTGERNTNFRCCCVRVNVEQGSLRNVRIIKGRRVAARREGSKRALRLDSCLYHRKQRGQTLGCLKRWSSLRCNCIYLKRLLPAIWPEETVCGA
jgi:hypothetical protein